MRRPANSKMQGLPPTTTISTPRPNTIATLSLPTRSKIGSAPFALCKRREWPSVAGRFLEWVNRRMIDSRCSRFFAVLIPPQKVFRSTASCRRRELPRQPKTGRRVRAGPTHRHDSNRPSSRPSSTQRRPNHSHARGSSTVFFCWRQLDLLWRQAPHRSES